MTDFNLKLVTVKDQYKTYKENKITREKEIISAQNQPIDHWWYNIWPDHGVPENVDLFNDFVTLLVADIKLHKYNTLVHCSAGVGRTGTLLVILYFKLKNKTPTLDEITDQIILMRTNHRMYQVQSDVQLGFIYKFFKIRHDSKLITQEFTKLNILIKPSICDKYNLDRYSNIYATETILITEIALQNNDTDTICKKYVNASIMPDFIDENNNIINKVFASECPNEKTKNRFLQLLKDYKIGRIIMLTNLMENGKEKCNDYTTAGLPGSKSVKVFLPLKTSTDEQYGYKTKYILVRNNDNLELI